MLHRVLAALVLAASAAPVLCAQDADPLKSDACKAALTAMDQVIAEPASKTRSTRVAAAREEAVVACLGGRSQGRAARSGAPDPVRSVPLPLVARPAQPAVPAVVLPAPALAIPRPTVITTCDPAGCWDSDGRRLNNMGPLLMSPRGPCTVQGALANCP